jgi:hypothetical protein
VLGGVLPPNCVVTCATLSVRTVRPSLL